MKIKKGILYKVGAVVLLLAIAGLMFVIGRGHTIYFDSKALDYNGQTYPAPYKIVVNVNGEQIAKLYDKERGMTTCIGQTFTAQLEVTQKKGGDAVVQNVVLTLPYDMDGIIINLPALLAGLPADAYLTQFIPTEVEEPADEEIVTDDLGLIPEAIGEAVPEG